MKSLQQWKQRELNWAIPEAVLRNSLVHMKELCRCQGGKAGATNVAMMSHYKVPPERWGYLQ